MGGHHGRRRSIAATALTVGLPALLLCGVARADNYTYKRTKPDDATAASMTLRATDFPSDFGLSGGRVKPDETPNHDSCNGYTPKQSDLVVTGDAQTRFRDSGRTMLVDSEVEAFQSSKMAATDVQRGKRMLSPACQAQAAKQEHLKLVSYEVLGHPKCSCDFAVSVMFETMSARPGLDLLFLLTAIRKGRFEATVLTNVGKATNSAQSRQAALSTALVVQAVAVKAGLSRLRST